MIKFRRSAAARYQEEHGIDNGGLFGKSELPDVLDELDTERDYYITALQLPLEKSK